MIRSVKLLSTSFIIILLLCCSNDDANVPIDETSENLPPQEIEDAKESLAIYYYSKRDGVYNIYKEQEDKESPIIIDNDHNDWWMRVSPNKQKMLWYKSPKDVPAPDEYNNYDDAELWMADPDGSNPQKVIDLDDYGWSAQGVADWSPDSKELVMAVIDESGFWHIYTTDADGDNPKKISQRNSLFADPSWSPDGEKIVYTAYPVDYMGNPFNFFNLEIHIMDRDGSNELRLTYDDLRDHDPYWSPDGKEIAFESQWNLLHCLIGKWAIRKYNFDIEQTSDVVKDDNGNGIPRWTNDSQHLYFARKLCNELTVLARTDREGNGLKTVIESDLFNILDCDLVE